MCGIVGYSLNQRRFSGNTVLDRALQSLRHRGPDNQSYVTFDGDATRKGQHIAMGHARFSLVDMSASGNQPFTTDDGKICVTLNGEIYNYLEIRRLLEDKGMSFVTTSDTEVLAKAYQVWGADCFERFHGFWAIALYDLENKRLMLARDRIGKAPIYICQRPGALFWASELKALLHFVPEERDRIHLPSVAHFANWMKKDFGRSTFHENIHSFPSGSFAWIDESGQMEPVRYWHLPTRRRSEGELSPAAAIEEFRETVSESVRIRMRADAPVAVQLSGGMDSSTLAALAAQKSDKVEAFTVLYEQGDQNEEPFARMVAEHYPDQVNYNVIRPAEDSFLDDLPQFAGHMDEPFHSPNQLSSQKIWRQMADRGMRAVLYGGGGDEVFSGYVADYYAPYLNLLLRGGKIGRFAREFFGCTEYPSGFAPKEYAKMVAKMLTFVPRKSTFGRVRFIPGEINPLSPELIALLDRKPPQEYDALMLANMQDWRMNYWLRNDNQNSMSVPIELRMPFLDHKVVEHAFTLPQGYLIRDGWLKWIMRAAMEKDLPSGVVWRRNKMGFPFPLKSWMERNKGALLALAEGSDCPFVDTTRLREHFEALCQADAEYTWGMISILMWWKYCVHTHLARAA